VQAADFTYEDLTQIIQSQNLNTLEAVLPKLPEEMRSRFVLMHTSRSLQGASAENPRAIMFSPNGKLTCSFNGESSQYGNDSLECFQFRSKERKFDFRQIVFPTAANRLNAVQFSLSNQTADGSISCTACHGADPPPNWDNYNFWPGAYGEQDDRIDLENEMYRSFRNGSYESSRYKWLIRENNSWAPYRLDAVDFGIAHRPNFRLTEIYGRLNALRAARILTEKLPVWERWAYVVSALQRSLSPAQFEALEKAGFNPNGDLQMAKIFGDIGMESFEWSTQIAADKQNYVDKPCEYQTGLSMFSELLAMTLLQEKAKSGNEALAEALKKILVYFSVNYSGDDLQINQVLNEIVPSPDFFGPGYSQNRKLVRPEAVIILVDEVLKRPRSI
jgi:hypothetical protein